MDFLRYFLSEKLLLLRGRPLQGGICSCRLSLHQLRHALEVRDALLPDHLQLKGMLELLGATS